jgi:pyoverdine/dityrosine biosynthesis protein Dit1
MIVDGKTFSQTIFVDPDSVTRFQTELIAEHMAAQRAAGK